MSASKPGPRQQEDSPAYLAKKRFFAEMITVYGRKPVQEVFADPSLAIYRLHLAESNRPGPWLDQLLAQAGQRGIEVLYHSREALSRISKNAREDQGVAIDVRGPGHPDLDHFLATQKKADFQLLALDQVTNPQNLGMIIRSASAGGLSGLLLPRQGGSAIGPLVIKASAGAVFKASLIRCEGLPPALKQLRALGADVCCLNARAGNSLFEYRPIGAAVFVLGNESMGVTPEVRALCNRELSIPMANGVESLNVAAAATLVAFRTRLR